ncbi:hypothetical protein DAEQUDRAFT_725087 [Daedalea quercina L-15889]|uniref:N-acetyltransferase domain-containing protein n=1 Tax=Daedalea quercina L-15889 TaxID=1314783 RepID=A0A165RCB1_9APHY|nr:hypothetical protein DAEQUDRAFT_725087 [Daedalea quercina L-15889]
MSRVKIERLPDPPDELIEASAALFALAMQYDGACISLVGGDMGLLPSMARAMIKAALLAAGEYYPAFDESGELLGYALWMPPGQELFATAEQREQGLNDFMDSLTEVVKQYYKDVYLKEFPDFVNMCMNSPTGKTDAWWLNNFCVHPARQKQGIGRRLIEVVMQKAKQEGHTVALAATRDQNVAVYESYGFKQKGRKMMPSPWGDWPLNVFVFVAHRTCI